MQEIIEKYGKLIMEVVGAMLVISIAMAVFFGGKLSAFISDIIDRCF